MEKSKKCVYCGTELPVTAQLYKRKYCSQSCRNKYKLRIKKPNIQAKLWQHEPATFGKAMEMYWYGCSSAAIARELGIPVGTMYSWVHDFGSQKERAKPTRQFNGKPIHTLSPKEHFRLAQTAEEWLEALRNSASLNEESYENEAVILVCGKLHGQSAGKLASVVYEKLKSDLLCGKTYAFCNKCGNTITTISWNELIYHISKYIKTHGTFIWPGENLGESIEITRAVFEHLISLQKYRKNAEKS